MLLNILLSVAALGMKPVHRTEWKPFSERLAASTQRWNQIKQNPKSQKDVKEAQKEKAPQPRTKVPVPIKAETQTPAIKNIFLPQNTTATRQSVRQVTVRQRLMEIKKLNAKILQEKADKHYKNALQNKMNFTKTLESALTKLEGKISTQNKNIVLSKDAFIKRIIIELKKIITEKFGRKPCMDVFDDLRSAHVYFSSRTLASP